MWASSPAWLSKRSSTSSGGQIFSRTVRASWPEAIGCGWNWIPGCIVVVDCRPSSSSSSCRRRCCRLWLLSSVEGAVVDCGFFPMVLLQSSRDQCLAGRLAYEIHTIFSESERRGFHTDLRDRWRRGLVQSLYYTAIIVLIRSLVRGLSNNFALNANSRNVFHQVLW